jgi:hypothetical protein
MKRKNSIANKSHKIDKEKKQHSQQNKIDKEKKQDSQQIT